VNTTKVDNKSQKPQNPCTGNWELLFNTGTHKYQEPLSKNIKIKTYKTIILSVLYDYEMWSLTLMDATTGGWKTQ
jgi:hypothetical protein